MNNNSRIFMTVGVSIQHIYTYFINKWIMMIITVPIILQQSNTSYSTRQVSGGVSENSPIWKAARRRTARSNLEILIGLMTRGWSHPTYLLLLLFAHQFFFSSPYSGWRHPASTVRQEMHNNTSCLELRHSDGTLYSYLKASPKICHPLLPTPIDISGSVFLNFRL